MRIPYLSFIIVSLWGMAILNMVYALRYPHFGALMILMIIAPFVMAGMSTGLLIVSNANSAEKATPVTKQKRTSPTRDNRLAELMEVMDEDEREAFKQALKTHYLVEQEKPKRDFYRDDLVDGELPFDAEEYPIQSR